MNIRKELTLNAGLASMRDGRKAVADRDGASQQLKDLVGFLDKLPRWNQVL